MTSKHRTANYLNFYYVVHQQSSYPEIRKVFPHFDYDSWIWGWWQLDTRSMLGSTYFAVDFEARFEKYENNV